MNTPIKIVFFMWLVFFVEVNILDYKLSDWGIYPRTWIGLIGIFTAPLLHGDIFHIISNTFPLLVLGVTAYFFYPNSAPKVFIMGYFLSGFLIWLLGRSYIHIGASGLIYTLASFLIFLGIFRRSFVSLIVSAATVFFYGSMLYGIFPTLASVSWESHLIGALVGIYAAIILRKKNQKTPN